ncbi:hypothetical protein [Pedobacter sp. MC2016-24]|uniref:hypothetical protein n=1 Tax=Pedobacter sp. MC2016-24 TaxID=2780090 RepID=UPI001882F533|nr:hypothetical protein [Pedobacter sp. MC2016-24]MBE9599871.1 hypothetical protein [Pedobacter sp. MC2016-24]
MKTVNSLSGGKTSSYLAARYPADLDVFALVCIDDMNAGGRRIDPKIRQMVNDKLQKYCSDQHEFLSTAEDPLILAAMFDLEQHIGREITWLRGIGFQQISNTMHLIPNKRHRYCTSLLKIDPIFNFLFRYHELPVKMRIGYRADEGHRVGNFKDTYFMATQCDFVIDNIGEQPPGNYKKRKILHPGLKGLRLDRETPPFITRWQEVPFRIGEFPMIEDQIVRQDVQRYWRDKDIEFPVDSNCQFCFWKHPLQIRDNYDRNPGIISSAMVMEEMIGGTFHSALSMQKIVSLAPQLDLFQMKGAGCHGGYCTD